MKDLIYQLISHSDGTRSQPFSAPSPRELANALSVAMETNLFLKDHFVLVLLEDSLDRPKYSGVPMMRVSTVVSVFSEKENAK